MGGTKTDLAILSRTTGPRRPFAQRRYDSAAYNGLADVARSFLDDVGMKVGAVCFAVAGPVMNGAAELTNLRWRIDEASLAAALEVERAWLLNYLVATASAIPLLRPDELHSIKEGEALRGGVLAVIAPGRKAGRANLSCSQRAPGGCRSGLSAGQP